MDLSECEEREETGWSDAVASNRGLPIKRKGQRKEIAPDDTHVLTKEDRQRAGATACC